MEPNPTSRNESDDVPSLKESALERLLIENLREQRLGRRWAMIRRGVTLFVLVALAIWVSQSWRGGHSAPVGQHTAMVSINGVIEAEGDVDAVAVNDALRAAFETKEAAGVLIRVNSPGGSPVQSGLIFDEIRRLKALHPNKPVVAVVEDIGASGAYYVAAAADSIYVNQASLVGSIGVRLDSFGLTEAIKKLGIERRLITAGENKAMLDPFLPQDPKHRQMTQQMLNEVHQQFINAVKEGRKDKLKPGNPEVFSGMVYTGAKSVELGLADGLGSVESVARDVIKAEEIVDYSYEMSVAERFAKRFGAAAGETIWRAMRTSAGGLGPVW